MVLCFNDFVLLERQFFERFVDLIRQFPINLRPKANKIVRKFLLDFKSIFILSSKGLIFSGLILV